MLAYTLKALYDRAGANRRLTLDNYRTLGGVQGAIAAKLASVLSDPEPTAEEIRALRRAFTRYLIRVDEGAVEGERLLRRVVPRASLPQSADRLTGRLVDAGLLTTSGSHASHRWSKPDSNSRSHPLTRRQTDGSDPPHNLRGGGA